MLATAPYRGAHFATFPPALVEPCILAATSERGCCPRCGAPWQRDFVGRGNGLRSHHPVRSPEIAVPLRKRIGTTTWEPTCSCPAAEPIPCLVLDPFAGSGTTLMVAKRLGRIGVGVELNPTYVALIRKRCGETGGEATMPQGTLDEGGLVAIGTTAA